jgi:hypothetical protein
MRVGGRLGTRPAVRTRIRVTSAWLTVEPSTQARKLERDERHQGDRDYESEQKD